MRSIVLRLNFKFWSNFCLFSFKYSFKFTCIQSNYLYKANSLYCNTNEIESWDQTLVLALTLTIIKEFTLSSTLQLYNIISRLIYLTFLALWPSSSVNRCNISKEEAKVAFKIFCFLIKYYKMYKRLTHNVSPK